MSHEKTLVGWVIKGIILPNYIGIIIKQYKDPYSPTSIMESRRVFFRGSHVKQRLKTPDFPLRELPHPRSWPHRQHSGLGCVGNWSLVHKKQKKMRDFVWPFFWDGVICVYYTPFDLCRCSHVFFPVVSKEV